MLHITLLGDSYSAGNGAGNYYGEKGSYRSNNNWAHRYADWLNQQGVKTTLTDLSYNGYTTTDVKNKQISKVPVNTDLVMLTIGGNDAKFADVVRYCFAAGYRGPKECENKVKYARDQFSDIIRGTREIFEELEKKIPQTSQIVLVGYPLLTTRDEFCLSESVSKLRTFCPAGAFNYQAGFEVRNAGIDFNGLQLKLVQEWNDTHVLKVTYIASVATKFFGHEPNPNGSSRNNKRWLNEFFETEGRSNADGITESKPSNDTHEFYHPNITGHEQIALLIESRIGIPTSAKEITSNSSDVDVAFVFDTTGSMTDRLDVVKRDIADTISQIEQETNSARFALVDYQDRPGYGGEAADYPSRVQIPFTSDADAVTAIMNELTTGFGGDIPETVYSGMMTALDLDWRPGARKMIIVMGDAPAKDPEPVTGYTWQTILNRSYEIDPVEVYVIDGLWENLSASIGELVPRSGGKVFVSSVEFSDATLESVDSSTTKPFGWIQGPYLIKVGESVTLDARASYAVTGEIVHIEWDLDGDSEFETISPSLLYEHRFTEEFGGTIGIKITDTDGRVGIGSTRLDVTDDGDTIPRAIDNCPDIANQNQADYDEDGIGDNCDDDIGWPTKDRDGIYASMYDISSNSTGIDKLPSSTSQPQSRSLTLQPTAAPTPTPLSSSNDKNLFAVKKSGDEAGSSSSETTKNEMKWMWMIGLVGGVIYITVVVFAQKVRKIRL
ncbi:peptidase [Candidatus Saccharibacteria bacterium]|nr:MAG: peptidase [Candidatus Saccharibacteria bacterium]